MTIVKLQDIKSTHRNPLHLKAREWVKCKFLKIIMFLLNPIYFPIPISCPWYHGSLLIYSFTSVSLNLYLWCLHCNLCHIPIFLHLPKQRFYWEESIVHFKSVSLEEVVLKGRMVLWLPCSLCHGDFFTLMFSYLFLALAECEKTLMPGMMNLGGEGDGRGWDGWMASPTQWTWVWVNSGSWWWTGKPGILQSMTLQRIGHDWATELNWTEMSIVLLHLSYFQWS